MKVFCTDKCCGRSVGVAATTQCGIRVLISLYVLAWSYSTLISELNCRHWVRDHLQFHIEWICYYFFRPDGGCYSKTKKCMRVCTRTHPTFKQKEKIISSDFEVKKLMNHISIFCLSCRYKFHCLLFCWQIIELFL